MNEHWYRPSQIYNMDESGFAVGASRTSRSLVNIRDKTSWKKIQGRQERITAIAVVYAAGVVGPPLLIFRSMHLSTAWVPDHTPPDWSFTTSKSGWTSDNHGYQWLTEVFEPWSRRRLPAPFFHWLISSAGSVAKTSPECFLSVALLACFSGGDNEFMMDIATKF